MLYCFAIANILQLQFNNFFFQESFKNALWFVPEKSKEVNHHFKLKIGTTLTNIETNTLLFLILLSVHIFFKVLSQYAKKTRRN